jgi:hypothetical protein
VLNYCEISVIYAPQRSGSLAQLVEQLAFNQLVVGSNPTRPTISKIWKAHENADFQIFFCLEKSKKGYTLRKLCLRAQST